MYVCGSVLKYCQNISPERVGTQYQKQHTAVFALGEGKTSKFNYRENLDRQDITSSVTCKASPMTSSSINSLYILYSTGLIEYNTASFWVYSLSKYQGIWLELHVSLIHPLTRRKICPWITNDSWQAHAFLPFVSHTSINHGWLCLASKVWKTQDQAGLFGLFHTLSSCPNNLPSKLRGRVNTSIHFLPLMLLNVLIKYIMMYSLWCTH